MYCSSQYDINAWIYLFIVALIASGMGFSTIFMLKFMLYRWAPRGVGKRRMHLGFYLAGAATVLLFVNRSETTVLSLMWYLVSAFYILSGLNFRLRSARLRGSQIGQKRWFQQRYFDKKKATKLRDRGWSQIAIARELGIGLGRVIQWDWEEYLPPDQRNEDI